MSRMLFLLSLSLLTGFSRSEVSQLRAEADFHSAQLTWLPTSNSKSGLAALSTSNSTSLVAVRACEQHAWGPTGLACRRTLMKPKKMDDGSGRMGCTLKGLRMATSYVISVREADSKAARRPKNFLAKQKTVAITTKEFKAHRTSCNATTTRVEIETGAFFAGRISIEHNNDDNDGKANVMRRRDCSKSGSGESSSELLVFYIDHATCEGVSVERERVRASLLVQESAPILTHSSRRFLVTCTFTPAAFTVRAGLNVPEENASPRRLFKINEDNYDNYSDNEDNEVDVNTDLLSRLVLIRRGQSRIGHFEQGERDKRHQWDNHQQREDKEGEEDKADDDDKGEEEEEEPKVQRRRSKSFKLDVDSQSYKEERHSIVDSNTVSMAILEEDKLDENHLEDVGKGRSRDDDNFLGLPPLLLTVPADYEHPVEHLALMMGLVGVAVLGSILTAAWVIKSRSGIHNERSDCASGTSVKKSSLRLALDKSDSDDTYEDVTPVSMENNDNVDNEDNADNTTVVRVESIV